MKIGTSLFLIVIILICFGYVLSDDMHVHKDLQETVGRIDQANSLAAEANENLKSCQVAMSSQEAELQSLRIEVSHLAERNSKLEAENAELANENGILRTDQPNGALLNMAPVAAVVIVAAQIALVLAQKMQKVKLGFQLPLTDRQEKSQSVCLTKEELKTIIEMRRKK